MRPPVIRPDKPLVYMRFRPAWAYIDGVRAFGRFFCERSFIDAQVAERSTVVIQEMLENAVKYSSRSADDELELSLTTYPGGIEFSITSMPEPEHLGVLREELDVLYSRSPEDAYFAAFARAAGTSDGGSRLGLARIRFEGGTDLKLSEHEDGRITLSARGSL